MKDSKEYIAKNKAAWNAAVPFHVRSSFYRQEAFLNGESTLKSIELDLLGDVVGKEILHLQCHFGQDTISLQRLGAIATGVDFSEAAIEEAKSIAKKLELPVDFVCSDIYHLPMVLHRTYDIVFTSYGVLGWLPDMNAWAAVVNRMLKPGGRLILVEFHPFIWTMDETCSKVAYDYFNNGPIIETQKGSYADRNAPIEQETLSWNHGLAEVISPLLKEGLHLKQFREFDYSPYNCFADMEEVETGKFRFSKLSHLIPMVYALQLEKPV